MNPLPLTTLGRSRLQVSRLGLAGSYGIDASGVERAFHELGVNYFFVTSRASGMVEGVRRLVRAGHRERMVIAAGAAIPMGFSVKWEAERLLKSLGVESIDVFHLFWVQAHWYVTGNTWTSLQSLKESGKAKALAISCHDRPMARSLVDELGLDALMIRYNAAHRGAEKEIFASLGETDRPGVIAYTATRWGKLLKASGSLPPMTPAECYRFALSHPKVDVVLCGPKSYEELALDAQGVSDGPLSAARLAEIKEFGDAVRGSVTGGLAFLGA